jgi:heme/copper-type cytochrome/quinol oxidase subunit 2
MTLPISLEFDSGLVGEDDLIEGTHRLLEVDNRLFLPVGIPIRLIITSSDVLHS